MKSRRTFSNSVTVSSVTGRDFRVGPLVPTPAACFCTQPSWDMALAGRRRHLRAIRRLSRPCRGGASCASLLRDPAWTCVGSRPPLSTPGPQRHPPRLLRWNLGERPPPNRQLPPRGSGPSAVPGPVPFCGSLALKATPASREEMLPEQRALPLAPPLQAAWGPFCLPKPGFGGL